MVVMFILGGAILLAGASVLMPESGTGHASNPMALDSQGDSILPAVENDAAENFIPLELAAPHELEEEIWNTEIFVRQGDTLSRILKRIGMFGALSGLTNLGTDSEALHRLRPGQKLYLRHSEDGLEQLMLRLSPTEKIYYIRSDHGPYIVQRALLPVSKQQRQASGSITHSLSVDGDRIGLSPGLIDKLATIFGWDIDFSVGLQHGDRFSLIWEEHWVEGNYAGNGDILAAEFINRGERFRALRHVDDAGRIEYYAPDGRAMRKQFLHAPVNYRRISSGFDPKRLHPVLGIRRPHRGIDYAAPIGTPVYATASGVVNFLGRKGGYGRVIFIRHGSRYTTVYAHLSKYASKLRTGSQVRQGQTIGYIGQSGIATGPHLHYELRVNGVYRDPHKVVQSMPPAKTLNGVEKMRFLRNNATALKLLEQLSSEAVAHADAP